MASNTSVLDLETQPYDTHLAAKSSWIVDCTFQQVLDTREGLRDSRHQRNAVEGQVLAPCNQTL